MKTNPQNIEVGQYVYVFDHTLWSKNGGDSKTDDFHRLAAVEKIYWKGGELLADVVFDYDKRVSKGHFVSGIRRNPK